MIHASADEQDYRLLAGAGLLLTSERKKEPITLTVGFPCSTFQINRNSVMEFYKGKHEIIYDVFTLNENKSKSVYIEIDKVQVIPEIMGCALSARHLNQHLEKGFSFVASIGYGTFEAALTNDHGIVDSTLVRTDGLRYALDITARELKKEFYLGMRTEHQLDVSFQNAIIVIDRIRYDLTKMREKALKQFYYEIISPALRYTWKDADFVKAEKLYLAGGGAIYPELVRHFRDEFRMY